MALRQWSGLAQRSMVGGVMLCALAGSPSVARAQDEPETKPLIVYLDEDQTRFLKFGASVQIWARYTEMNPGSKLSEGGLVQDEATDVSIRRFRVSLEAQLSERIMLPLSLSPPRRHALSMPKEVEFDGRGTSGEHPALECQAQSGPGAEYPAG